MSKKTISLALHVARYSLLFCLLFVFPCFADTVGYTEDPMKIGVGARVMGMGKAYSAVSDDNNSVFMNPAGLAGIKSWSLLNMYTNLLGDVNYTTISFASPVKLNRFEGILGLSYISSTISNIISPSQSGYNYFNYRNNVYVLSLGKGTGKLSVGANLKFFDEGYTGFVSDGATGINMDLGIKYTPSSTLSFGLAFQNMIPESNGGGITWKNGSKEKIPSLVKYGAAIKLLKDKMLLAIDNDIWLERKVPPLFHAGLEYYLAPALTLRAGLDQSLNTATGVTNNPTFGVGLKLASVTFDYAYHPFYEETGNVTHFFSIGVSAFSLPKKKLADNKVTTAKDKPLPYIKAVSSKEAAVPTKIVVPAKVTAPAITIPTKEAIVKTTLPTKEVVAKTTLPTKEATVKSPVPTKEATKK